MTVDWSITIINEKHFKCLIEFHVKAVSSSWAGWWVSLAGEEAVGHMHPCICGTDKYAKPEVDQKHALSPPCCLHTLFLHLHFLYSVKCKIKTILFIIGTIYLCLPLAYGYLQWMVKWSLLKRIIFITHMGMLEIRNGLGTGGTLHSHGIVFCVLQ